MQKMNRTVFIARTVKGLSEKQVANGLGIMKSAYKELELELTSVTPEIAEKLEAFYQLPADYFIVGGFDNIKISIEALEQQKKILASSDFSNLSIPSQTHISLAKIGLDALIAKQEQILLLKQNRELERENDALRELYNSMKTKINNSKKQP